MVNKFVVVDFKVFIMYLDFVEKIYFLLYSIQQINHSIEAVHIRFNRNKFYNDFLTYAINYIGL